MPLPTRQFYEMLADTFGPSLDALGWTSLQAQETRFLVLHEAYKVRGSVLDVGCGFGDFSPWFAAEDYTGIDEVKPSIDEARRKHPDKTFIHGDVLTADLTPRKYVFASGVLGIHLPVFVLPIVKRMWELTEWVLAFNWYKGVDLSADGLVQLLKPADGAGVRTDYISEDTTIYLYKKEPHAQGINWLRSRPAVGPRQRSSYRLPDGTDKHVRRVGVRP